MKRLLDRLYGLLAATAERCPVCDREHRHGADGESGFAPVRHAGPRSELQRLCGRCRASIPWIMRAACPICGRPERCGDCLMRRVRHFERCRGAVRYDETMKAWLAQYKYQGIERLESVFAAMLAASCESLVRSAGGGFDVVSSVPLSPQRLEERGFNQAERMAIKVAAWYGIPYLPLLERRVHTAKMSSRDRAGRLTAMRGAFAPLAPACGELATGAGDRIRVLLVDDIYTTGSTMEECARTLCRSDARMAVYGALWARA